MPKLDMGALRKAIAKGQAAAVGTPGPGGRPRTGTKAFVREHLDAVLALRDETGATWSQMVAALRERHDLRQGDGQPITGRRLSALVSACLAERAREEAATVTRASRRDLAGRAAAVSERRPVDSPKVRAAPSPATPVADLVDVAPVSEDEIRRTQRARHQHLFKKG